MERGSKASIIWQHRLCDGNAVSLASRSVRCTILIAACLLPAAGCVTMDASSLHLDSPAKDVVCQMAVAWNNEIAYMPDPAHNGARRPGLAGRLYLFGQDGKHAVAGEGSLVVDLYDDAPAGVGHEPRQMEEWRLDNGTLKQMLSQDMIGLGYNLFLPWSTYRPEITRVHLALRYQPTNPKAAPVYHQGDTMAVCNQAADVNKFTTLKNTSEPILIPNNVPVIPHMMPPGAAMPSVQR
jgi:hypothetical protein